MEPEELVEQQNLVVILLLVEVQVVFVMVLQEALVVDQMEILLVVMPQEQTVDQMEDLVVLQEAVVAAVAKDQLHMDLHHLVTLYTQVEVEVEH